jgi:hypothetical protein
MDCGIQYAPWQMDSDHVRGVKALAISRKNTKTFSIRRVMAEIAKCEVVCANCHRDRTHRRHLAEKGAP